MLVSAREGERAGWFAVVGGDGESGSPYVWGLGKPVPRRPA